MGPYGGPGMKADLVLYDRFQDRCLAVLDAKYKAAGPPAAGDVHQVRSYAEFLGCREALLVYPQALDHPLNLQSPGICARSIGFPLDGDLDAGGQALLELLTSLA